MHKAAAVCLLRGTFRIAHLFERSNDYLTRIL